MEEVIKKELLGILSKTTNILEAKEEKELEELKELSDQAVEVVALHKNLDIISLTVLVYSLYKVIRTLPAVDYQRILAGLKFAKKHLEQDNLGGYNKSIKSLFTIIKKSNAKIKEHLADIMQAARIKKSAVLLEKGLSIGQAAGLMGLSNWDLQQYAGKTLAFESHQEATPAKTRLLAAFKIFNL